MKFIQFVFLSCLFVIIISCVDKRDLSTDVVIAHITSNPDGLHPFNDNSANRSYIFNYTQKALLRMDLKSLKTIPALVKELPVPSENGLTYSYELIDGVKWDDGSPLTVDDIIFTTKLQLCPLTNNTQIRGVYSSVIKNVIKDVTNPNKFVVECKSLHISNGEIYSEISIQQKKHWDPNGVLDNLTFEQIHDPNFKASEEITNWFNQFNKGDNSYQPDRLVGLGPYQVTEFEVGSYIKLKRKENWYGDQSELLYDQNNPKEIIFKIIKDDAAAYLAIKNQQIDVSTGLGTTKLIKLQELDYFRDSYHSDFLDQYSFSYLGMNMRPDGIEYKPYFVDKRVRRAMAHLVPVDEIIDVMVKGKAKRQAAQVSPLKESYNTDLKLIDFNIEKAVDLLEEAGWVDTDADNIRDKMINGEKLQFSFNLGYVSGSSSTKEVVLMIKEEMYKAGIKLNPTPMDFTLFYKNAQDHKFDMMWGGWGASAGYSDPTQIWHTESWANKGSNFTGFGDAESDSLILQANLSLDKEKHIAAIKALQKKIYDEQPYIFMYSLKRKIAIHKRFDNANMYNERPGVILNNLLLRPEFAGSYLKPE